MVGGILVSGNDVLDAMMGDEGLSGPDVTADGSVETVLPGHS
jgi:hypothetical protein